MSLLFLCFLFQRLTHIILSFISKKLIFMEENFDAFKHIFEELIPFNKFLGMKLLEIEKDFAKAILPFKPEFIGDPRANRLHGGISATLIDVIGGIVAMTALESFDDKIATVDMRIDYLRPGKALDVIGESRIIRRGSRLVVTEMKLYHAENPTILLAVGKGVYSVKKANDDC